MRHRLIPVLRQRGRRGTVPKGKSWRVWIIDGGVSGTSTPNVSTRAGDVGRPWESWARRTLWAAAFGGFLSTACFGIDNPDAPDLVAQFQGRASGYEARISAETGTTNGMVAGDASYQGV